MKVWGDVLEELTEANCCQLEPRFGKMKAFIIHIIRNNSRKYITQLPYRYQVFIHFDL